MRAVKGVLLTWWGSQPLYMLWQSHYFLPSDAAVKQILLTMNEQQSFIIEDLDDHHLVIKADEEFRVRRQLETELEKNTYSLE
ncbi:hypothetical protein D9757_003929 [Collybiopsis confluens]|uniref:General transcription and DNA repair factor IIH subunit TFB5 n=1 Tax=Collybiopsis confluens TaxID=2823264 RepID=A0A8H5HWX3_9AGAR|nr:hypothetical protein D9757_003929 [Collybiopsis confluens]